jgi:beta-carotene ketolase (CrtW type)
MGIVIAISIILLWGMHLFYILTGVDVLYNSPVFYMHIIIQTYFFTGLFITAHDAMHGSLSKSKKINMFVGWITAFLFAGLSYKKLLTNHFKHHKSPALKDDPDFYNGSQNFFVWWMVFLFRYISFVQIIIMAVIFNLFKIFFNENSILFFWVLPAVLSTLQLFYFGTYQPHKQPHNQNMEPHKARTQKPNHLWAMLSCYFFGYHFEHHDSPKTPWWQLYKFKNWVN